MRTTIFGKAFGAFLAVIIGIGTASTAQAVPFTKGDIFASVGNGLVKEFTPAGVLVQTLNSTTGASEMTGSAFDSAGNLFATGFGTSTLSKFDNNGVLQSANFIAGNNGADILRRAAKVLRGDVPPAAIPPKWDGRAAERIVDILARVADDSRQPELLSQVAAR